MESRKSFSAQWPEWTNEINPFWKDEQSIIYNVDCERVLELITPGTIDITMTDPPYGLDIDYSDYCDDVTNLINIIVPRINKFIKWSRLCVFTPGVNNLTRYNKPAWTMAWTYEGSFMTPWGFNCWQPILVYGHDPYLKDRLGCMKDVINGTCLTDEKMHPCAKPLSFWVKLLERVSSPKRRMGQIVIDPFMGSGTTLRAARKLGMKSIGIDISKQYCELAIERLRQSEFSLEI